MWNLHFGISNVECLIPEMGIVMGDTQNLLFSHNKI